MTDEEIDKLAEALVTKMKSSELRDKSKDLIKENYKEHWEEPSSLLLVDPGEQEIPS